MAQDRSITERELKGIAAATANSNTAIALDTFGANYNTFIAVWTGTHPDLDLVACNNDASETQQSQVAFQVESGTTYYIEVGQP